MAYREIKGKQLFYQDIGEGFPLLLGHSFLWDSNMWKPQIEALSKNFRLIVPDLWSHGQSDPIDKQISLEEIADDYWDLMQSLGLSEFGIVGLSVGGMWGVEMTLKHPDAIQALVLMDTFVGNEASITQQKYFGMLDMIEKANGFPSPLLDQVVPLFFSPKVDPQLAASFRNSLESIPSEKIPGIVLLGRTIFSRPNRLDELSAFKQPALVIVGKDDIPRPPEEAREMASRLPQGKLHIIEDTGHICNLEKPEEVTKLLTDFLAAHLLQCNAQKS